MLFRSNGTYTANRKNRYKESGGTTAASAHVVGVAALMCYVDPTMTYARAKSILQATTDDVYKKGRDTITGSGKVNAYNAVAKAATQAGYSLKAAGKKTRLTKSRKGVKLKGKAGEGNVTLTWSKDVRRNLYYVYRKTGSGKYKLITKTTALKYVDKKASAKKKNYYKVRVRSTTKDGKQVWTKYSNKVVKKAKPIKKTDPKKDGKKKDSKS